MTGTRSRRIRWMLAAATILPMAVLSWLAWKVIEQDRAAERQRHSEALEVAGQRLAVDIERWLQEEASRLARRDAIQLVTSGLVPTPDARILYQPSVLPTQNVSDVMRVEAPQQLFRPAFAWTPDSRSVVVKKTGGATNEMWFVPIDGRPAHRIEMPLRVSAGWQFNPRTDQVTFGVGGGTQFEVWKMENFLPSSSPR